MALELSGITCALGGSGLLMALGLADEARDWDLTTDAPLDQVATALRDFPAERMGPNGIHADNKLMLEGGVVEVIVGFSIRSGEAVVRLPTRVSGRWNEIPIGSPEVWAVAYALLGRTAKATLLFDWLARRGADGEAVARMLDEPLPEDLRARLVAALRSSPSSRA